MKFSKFLSILMLSLVVSPSLSKSLEYLSDDNLFPELVSFAPTELKGIDVSSYQGKINWKEVSEAGIKFVIARSTVRGGEMDSQFENNYKGAKKYGIPFAAYHFSYFLTDEQARYIRMEYRKGKSYYRLAIKFGVNTTTIKQIVEYKSYKKALGLPKAVKGENIYV